MATEFKLPELGEGVDSAEVARVLVAEGDTIEADQDVLELETDKAVAELPCPLAGEIKKIHVSQGDTVEVGQTILTVEESDGEGEHESTDQADKQKEKQKEEEAPEAEKPAQEAEEVDEEAAEEEETRAAKQEDADQPKEPQPAAEREAFEPSRQEADAGEAADEAKRKPAQDRRRQATRVVAGPATRRLARKLDVDLQEIEVDDGRVTQEDVVRAHVAHGGMPGAVPSPKLPDFSRFGPIRREERNRIAQRTTERLTTSWQTIPHVTQHARADITQLEKVRKEYMSAAGADSPKVTVTAVAIKAVTGLLKRFPAFNSSLDVQQNELILKDYCHIGVAVDTQYGLLVPVIRDADRMTIRQLAAQLHDLARAARTRKLKREQMEGGTFTISNQGGIGGEHFTPIINHPEAAILGLGRAHSAVKMVDGQPAERLILPISLSYDHRIVNGADAARFITELSRLLSAPAQLMIEA